MDTIENIQIPGGMEAVKANYIEQVVEEYKNNPLIEALPPILSKEQVIDRLAYYPPFRDEERMMESHYRYHFIQRLFQYFQPLNIHLDLESRVSRMIRQGYLARNPFSPQYAEEFQKGYQMIKNQCMEITSNHSFSPSAYGFTFIGTSGMGKSTSINKILSNLPQVIVHSQYKGIDFGLYQIVYLKLDCPFDGSVKGLCVDFFMKVDSLLGTNYYKKFGQSRLSVNTMLPAMSQIARSSSLGILIADEIQHLSTARSGGADKMLNFFVTIINTIGLPVVLIGTNKAMSVLQSEFRQARRGSGQGDLVYDRMKKDASWDILLEGLWDYQWVRKHSPLTPEISATMYDESQGITDIAVKLYAMAQIRAITTGKEDVTPALIRYVAKENLKLVRPMLNALKAGDYTKISEYSDISSLDINDFMNQQYSKINLDKKIKEAQMLKKVNKRSTDNLKEQAVLKLLDLDVEPAKAKKFVDAVLKEDLLNNDVKDIVKKAYRQIIDSEVKVPKKEKAIAIKYNEKDLRFIIAEGKKAKLSAYEALKNYGYIKAPKGDYLQIG